MFQTCLLLHLASRVPHIDHYAPDIPPDLWVWPRNPTSTFDLEPSPGLWWSKVNGNYSDDKWFKQDSVNRQMEGQTDGWRDGRTLSSTLSPCLPKATWCIMTAILTWGLRWILIWWTTIEMDDGRNLLRNWLSGSLLFIETVFISCGRNVFYLEGTFILSSIM